MQQNNSKSIKLAQSISHSYVLLKCDQSLEQRQDQKQNSQKQHQQSTQYETQILEREQGQKQPQNRCGLIKGILFGVIGATMLHSNRVLIRLQYDYFYLSPSQAMYYRSLLFFLVTLSYAKYKRVDFFDVPRANNTRKWLYFRCLMGFLASFGMVNTLNMIEYSKTIVLTFTYPLFTIIFARIILKEKIHALEIISIVTGFLGVCLYANPQWLGGKSMDDIKNQGGNDTINSGKYQVIGIIFAMIASLSQGLVVISLRTMGKVVDKIIPQLYFSLVSVVFFPSLYFAQNVYNHEIDHQFVQHHEYSWMFLVLILFQGIFSFLGQIMWQLAYIYEKAARVTVISYFEIVLAFVFEVILFHGVIQISDVVAALLIVGCSFLIAILKCTQVIK